MLHAVILVSFELLPFSFKFVDISSLLNSHDGDGSSVVVVCGDCGGGGSADENCGPGLESISVYCLFVSGDKR